MDENQPAPAAAEPQAAATDPAPITAEAIAGPASAPVASEPVAGTVPVDTIFDAWVLDQIYNSPVSRATEAFNHLITIALPDLRRRILKGA